VRAYLLGIDKSVQTSRQSRALLDAGIGYMRKLCCVRNQRQGSVGENDHDLAAEYPRITSVAIVPLGLTRYNTDPRLTRVTPEFCREVIDQVGVIQKRYAARLGTNFALLGDEIYLRAGTTIPGRSHYGDYPQIEDGVGMVRSFKMILRNSYDGSNVKIGPANRNKSGTIFTALSLRPYSKK
jgi:hypothetical protein